MIEKRNGVEPAPQGDADDNVALRMDVGKVRMRKVRKRAPGRPTAAQADQLRDAVLHAALDAFLTRGFEATSIEGIARSAKVAKITLYRQYGSKEQLFFEITRYAQADVRRNLQSMTDTNGAPDKVLRELIMRLHEGMTNPNYLAVLRMVIAESQRFPEISRAMLNDADFVLEPVIHYLQKLKDDGHIEIDSARESAIQLSCLAGGGARYVMVKPSRQSEARDHWADSLCKLFFSAWKLRVKVR